MRTYDISGNKTDDVIYKMYSCNIIAENYRDEDGDAIRVNILKKGHTYILHPSKTTWEYTTPAGGTALLSIESISRKWDVGTESAATATTLYKKLLTDGAIDDNIQITIPQDSDYVLFFVRQKYGASVSFLAKDLGVLDYIDTYTPIINTAVSGIDLYKKDTFAWYEGVAGTPKTAIVNARAVYNAGVSFGDIAPVIYENGEPIIKDNRMYYTKSSARHLGGMGAAVYEYNIGTGELHLTGIIGGYKNVNNEEILYNSVAIHVMYNRNTGVWQYTTGAAPVTSHVLHYGHSYNSPLHGRTIIEFYALEYEGTPNGDEDPVVYYSDELQKWVLVYCKVVNNVYKAVLQTSDYSDRGFTLYKVATNDVNTTGLNVCRVNNIMYVLSGDAADNGVNRFAVLSIPGLEFVCHLNLDYNNGGWRAWNSLVAVPESDYTKYYLLTFDKSVCSPSWEFTYGNLYMYCSVEKNKGLEYPLIVNGESISHPIQNGVDIDDLHLKLLWARPYSLEDSEEIIMSSIDVTQNVRRSGSNLYETVGDTLEQTSRGLSLTADGEAKVYGGSHQPGTMYVLSVENIESGDKRYIQICDSSGNLVLQVAVNGSGEVLISSSNASESKAGDIVHGSKELLIYTGGNKLNIYSR